ncbi:hypothetical protein AUR66_00240, partial [Haloferax profundi]
EDTAERAESVAAATEEQTASLGEVSNGADRLASQSERLMALVDSFTVDVSVSDADFDQFDSDGQSSEPAPRVADAPATDGGTDADADGQ